MKTDSSAFYYSGYTSSVRNVLKTMNVKYKDSAGKAEWSRVYAENFESVVNQQKIQNRSMPNVKGMGLKDALYLLENMNVKVIVKGRGKVKSQSLEAGTAFQKNQIVTLELN
jgi:cell division protein FtsI (penicillin-binding protein 3)